MVIGKIWTRPAILFVLFLGLTTPSFAGSPLPRNAWSKLHVLLVQGNSKDDSDSVANLSFFNTVKYSFESLSMLGVPGDQVLIVTPDESEFPSQNVVPALGRADTVFRRAIERMEQKVATEPEAVLLVVILAHGLAGVLDLDDRRSYLFSTELKDHLNIGKLKDRKTVVLIASCYSGSFRESITSANQILLTDSEADKQSHSFWKPGRGYYSPLIWNFFSAIEKINRGSIEDQFEDLTPNLEGALKYAQRLRPISYPFYGNSHKLHRGTGVRGIQTNLDNLDPWFFTKREVRLGDLDGDGKITDEDLNFASSVLIEGKTPTDLESFVLDMNQDGVVSKEDYAQMQKRPKKLKKVTVPKEIQVNRVIPMTE